MKLFLANTSSRKYLKKYFTKVLFILESYFYFKEWQIPLIHSSKDFLLDSGAFTFIKSTKTKTPDFDKYLKRYIDFINKYDVKHFFELDIDSVVGHDKVLEYRKKLEYETNKKCIPVWHKSRGKEEYYRLCENYDYIAIGGLAIKEIKKNEYKFLNNLCTIANQRNCKIHALGFTPKNLKDYNFYSCDSTTWTLGARLASAQIFKNNYINLKSYPSRRLINYKELDKFNLYEWIKYQKYLYYKC